MRGGSKKGSKFERDMCRQFSLWFTSGEADDYFWRTPSSGGRATTRVKKGFNAADYAGDMMSINPAGRPLTSRCLLEFKAGYSKPTSKQKLSLTACIDAPKTEKQPLLITWWQRLLSDLKLHDKKVPLLIFKRDRKEPCIAIDIRTYQFCFTKNPTKHAVIKYGMVYLVVMPLSCFFEEFNPGMFCDVHKQPITKLKKRRKKCLRKKRLSKN